VGTIALGGVANRPGHGTEEDGVSTIRTLIMGAAGRDFHDFNTRFRDDPGREVVAFTAAQIPFITDRRYPAGLAGARYPHGIAIHDEVELEDLISAHDVDEVYFAYSDVSYESVMHKAARAQAAGASFVLGDPQRTMLTSTKPIISVCAVRTGCGKSQTTRFIANGLKALGKKVAVVRHPMPYGDLEKQRCQRFASVEDLARHRCTIEEMEEYEPHLAEGHLVFAGVDYADILHAAEKEADVVLWDGGNNDLPFFRPDLHIVVADPHRAGDERRYYPSEVNARLADVFVINKEDSAPAGSIDVLERSLKALAPHARILHAESRIVVDEPAALVGKRVLCVEDGPSLTHGGMKIGAATLAAERAGAAVLVDPRPFLRGSLVDTFGAYPDIGPLLPAMGYSDAQVQDLENTINAVDCDAVLIGTPIDLSRIVRIAKPAQRARYDLVEKAPGSLMEAVSRALS